ncbi:carbonic anhydrase 6-like [Sturnira hondurensis]|uniref:carbonic anhydrase 6-like n=1 Tax=Sturnira hondurensis TaxID=192404 RepID=UPI001879E7EC|nr:carbonic anhydrase 6-like [Sturnira hondurensis]
MIYLPPTMRMTVRDGTEYLARQMHLHWGSGHSDTGGCEHVIDGVRYAAEIHVVHYNSKYSSYDEAMNAQDGIATLAGRVEVG